MGVFWLFSVSDIVMTFFSIIGASATFTSPNALKLIPKMEAINNV